MWNTLRPIIINFLKGVAVREALKRLLGPAAGGFKAWLVKYIVEHLFESLAVPVILYTYRKGELYYDQTKGKLQIRRLNNAKDLDSYNDAVDDILQ